MVCVIRDLRERVGVAGSPGCSLQRQRQQQQVNVYTFRAQKDREWAVVRGRRGRCGAR
jgi:hypothetical protein